MNKHWFAKKKFHFSNYTKVCIFALTALTRSEQAVNQYIKT